MTPAVLKDVSSQANITSPPVGCYAIANEVLTLVLQSCCFRRNLASLTMYTLRKRTGSNCHDKTGEDRIGPREA